MPHLTKINYEFDRLYFYSFPFLNGSLSVEIKLALKQHDPLSRPKKGPFHPYQGRKKPSAVPPLLPMPTLCCQIDPTKFQ